MKKLILAFAFLIMLAGGTVSLLKYMSLGPFEITPEELAAQQAEEATKEKTKALFESRPRYIEMDPIQVPVFQDNDVAATIMIHYKLEVLNVDNERLVAKSQRRLGDALLKDFSFYIPRTLRNNKTLDVTLVKYRILMTANKMLGKDVVNDALIQAMTSTADN
ncbi:hypothetical protein [Magnetovibrio sp.]|uniref:hypothetical protein n=1 Tax=Magnetovibrio sp. TaxID=2024836 RepID=UPI002F92F324